MKKSIKKIIGITLISSLLLGTVGPAFAGTDYVANSTTTAYKHSLVSGNSAAQQMQSSFNK